jgi:hypothetical protein
MAVQQLAKKQAKKEKKKQKDLDAKFAKDEEKAIERAGQHQEFMKGIYKQSSPKVKEPPQKNQERNLRHLKKKVWRLNHLDQF